MSFGSGSSDTKKLEELRERAKKLTNSINWYDKKLLRLEAASPMKAVLDREKDRVRKKAYEKNKEYTKQVMDSHKEKMEKKAKIESITQNAMVLNKWLVKNSKEEHIPDAMKPVVVNLLNAIDFSSKRYLNGGEMTRTDISLAKALSDVREMMGGEVDGATLYALYGPDMDEDMRTLVEAVNNYARVVGDNEYVLNQMTAEELQKLHVIVRAVKASVTKMNQFHVAHTKKNIVHVSQEGMLERQRLGQVKLHSSKLGKGLSQMLNWGNVTPFFAFKKLGSDAQLIFEALQDGWDKFAFNISKVINYANKVYKPEEVKKWSKEVKSFKIVFNGETQEVKMSTAQIMSLYCLQKREQAKGHIMGGGIRITDIETKGGMISQSDGVILTETELNKVIGSLTARQKEVADALQKFMNEDCAEWGNEISMARFGYKAFGEENYFPIRSDENITGDGDVKEKEKSLYRLLNMSFTKALTDKANNRIVVDNIFDVFAQHTSEMAKYNALALPVLDAVRWFNYNEKGEKVKGHFKNFGVKQSIEKAFGNDGKNYVMTFLEDLNGADNVGRDRLAKGFISNAKIASVGSNAKVVALQPTSYLRASAVIDPKYLAAGLAKKPNPSMAEKWCGMANWKALGFYDINIQRGVADLIKHDKSLKDKSTEASMKGAELADKVTMGYLWNACELEVKSTRKDLALGSDEYYTAIGKRLRDIIYQTQVVDSTMTRSHMMRSGDTWDKILTNFASEPTVSYNMLMDAYYDFELTKRKEGFKKAFFNKQNGKRLARTMVAYTVTNAVTALLELGFEVFRDDDEDKDAHELLEMYLENMALNQSVLNKIPYVKDCISLLQGFSSSRMDTQWIQYFAYAAKGYAKLFSGEGNAYTTAKNTLKALSYGFGVPGYNLARDVAALWNEIIGEAYPSMKIK